MNSKLPEGWREVEVNEICNLITDGTHKTPTYTKEGIPFISTINLIPFKKNFKFDSYKKFISEKEHKELIKRAKPEKGDLLISKCGTIGVTQVIREDYEFSIFVGLMLVKPKKEMVSSEYLEIYFNSPAIKSRLEAISAGSSRATLTINGLKKFKIILPPLPTQKKIVSILEKAEKAKEWRKEADELTDHFLKGILYDFLKDAHNLHIQPSFHNTNKGLPEGFIWKRLKEVALDVADIDHNMPKAVHRGIPFISAKDISDHGDISFEDTKFISKEDFKRLSRKIKPEKGDILYSRIGTVGRAAIVTVDFDFLASYSCCTIKPNTSIINTTYLAPYLTSDLVLRQAKHGTRGIGVPDLGMREIKDFLIAVPPTEIQNKFASIVTEVEAMKEQQKHSKQQLENLFNSLMQRAFVGELA